MSVRNIDDVTIRPATNQDRDKIVSLVFSVLAEFGLPSDLTSKDADLNDIEANYIQPGGVFEVLEDRSGKLIGTVGLFPVDDTTCELRKMYFIPEIRGIGLGRQVLERMIATARDLGFTRMQLETVAVLEAAVHLYKRAGFVPIKTEHVSARCDQAYGLDLTSWSAAPCRRF
jgi:putative acetyltransferase